MMHDPWFWICVSMLLGFGGSLFITVVHYRTRIQGGTYRYEKLSKDFEALALEKQTLITNGQIFIGQDTVINRLEILAQEIRDLDQKAKEKARDDFNKFINEGHTAHRIFADLQPDLDKISKAITKFGGAVTAGRLLGFKVLHADYCDYLKENQAVDVIAQSDDKEK